MATPEELQAIVAQRLLRGVQEELTGAQVLSALTGGDPSQQQALLNAIKQNNSTGISTAVRRLVRDKVTTLAAQKASTILSDSTVSLEELSDILGV